MSQPSFAVSMVANAASTETKRADAANIIDKIREGKWREKTTEIRQAFQKARSDGGDLKAAKIAVDPLKKALPAVMFSGQFESRKKPVATRLKSHSGLLCADLDDLGERLLEVRGKLTMSPSVWALFLSPTGNGLKVIFRVPPDAAKHSQSFRAVRTHMHELCGAEIDESCKDVSRLCFVSDDPDAHLNADAIELVPAAESAKSAEAASPVVTATQIERRRVIAEQILGTIQWVSADEGFCACPGQQLHTTPDGERHCRVKLDQVPTIFCFHDHCQNEICRRNNELRSVIGRAEPKTKRRREASKGGSADEETLARLASLAPLDLDRSLRSEAKALGVTSPTLRREVENYRRSNQADGLQGNAVFVETIEAWPSEVDGADVLDAISNTFSRYLSLRPGAADALALWSAHAHIFDAFECSPRLHLTSPEKQCGKTTARDCLKLFVPRPLLTENLSLAVLFRVIQKYKPTLLADECDTWLRDNEELRGLLNAGHRRGGQAFRCVGDDHEVRGFAVFTPVALCGIGDLPPTLQDRSIVIKLQRAKAGEVRCRFDSRNTAIEQELCRKLVRYIADNRRRIETCDPRLPDGVFNRLADNWRPLFAIAEVAGGDWPQRAAKAFVQLVSGDDTDTHGIGTMLLADIRDMFPSEKAERIFSRDLVSALCSMKERPWPEANNGRAITENWLARHLRRFGITPRTLRAQKSRAKGYEWADFKEVFDRYLPKIADSKRDTRDKPKEKQDPPPPGVVTPPPAVTPADGPPPSGNIGLSQCHALTAPDTGDQSDGAQGLDVNRPQSQHDTP